LKGLNHELNRYLAEFYLVGLSTKVKEYKEWLLSHQPFHWFVEFFGIMNQGGFDVIIGNPPYIELKAVKQYQLRNYDCISAGNLYALVLERCFSLCSQFGRQGFIVPVSSVSTDRYEPLQLLLTEKSLYYSSFDDRPSRLFDGLEHIRLTIHIIDNNSSRAVNLYSTRYHKWAAVQRSVLFSSIQYASVENSLISGSLPKLTNQLEMRIVSKLSNQPCLSSFYNRHGSHSIFYSRKVGYFLQVLDFEPQVLDGQGNKRPPSEFKGLFFEKQDYAQIALCALNSSLFYWFITVFSDCRHVNKREVDAFTIDLAAIANQPIVSRFSLLSLELMNDIKRNSEIRKMKFSHDILTVQCIIPKKSKPIIDEIDKTLAKCYGFDDEELDFIINYDIKYRLGRDGDDE